jgi:hypothetical protein
VVGTLADEFLPEYDVTDEVAGVVGADAATTWAALMEVDLVELGRHRSLGWVLGAIRVAPQRIGRFLRHEPRPTAPPRLRLRDMTQLPSGRGGWVVLRERPGEEIALGLVGKFWRPAIDYAAVRAEDFRAFDEPGYTKTVYALSVRPLGGEQSMLSAVMRTAATDERARRSLRRYWTLGVGTGAHELAGGLIEAARKDAEQRCRT